MNPISNRGVAAIATLAGAVGILAATPAIPQELASAVRSNPLRQAYFGELHLHTSYSLDAYVGHGTKVGLDEAYRFAKGEVIQYLGKPQQRREPLDFMAITDHAENIGVFNQLEDPDSAVSRSALGRFMREQIAAAISSADGRRDKNKIWPSIVTKYQVGETNPLPAELRGESMSAWQRVIEAANRHYAPGRFTTFIGYEWTSMPGGAGLHRNVIFRGSSAPFPFTAFDSRKPEDLWAWLDRVRAKGYEALAIPHNSNGSRGMMYGWLDSDGKAIGQAYASMRQANEPLSEISQSKGSSEIHPLLSPNDEFASFEILDQLAARPGTTGETIGGSYLRSALSRGLILQRRLGINPYRDGFVGGSDFHNGLSSSAQADYSGEIGGYGSDPTREQSARLLLPAEDASMFDRIPIQTTSGHLTGVWAESNTREVIYDALRRRETFATSGTRLQMRFFGGWSFDRRRSHSKEWVARAYADGVAMGSDLPSRPVDARAPQFLIWAIKDPDGANLDRVQVVKVWEERGAPREKIFDVVWSDRRRPDRQTGRLPAVGDTVDRATGKYSNTIGAAELKSEWVDPEFDADQFAAYYLRVLEIPTPRWSTLLAIKHRLPLPKDVPATVQQRGWSSPIWYVPTSR